MITPVHYFSTCITLLFVSYLGYHTTKKVKSSQDFAVGGRRLSGIQVSGSIIATIVGGASTIGTAQLAFQKGVSAVWFTLGASIACLFLGLFMAGPLRRAEVDTIPQFLSRTYGVYAGIAASVLTSFAIFVHITGQVLSAVAILTSIFHVGVIIAVFISIILIISYIFFGGFLGTSMVGIVKSILLYFTLIISGIIVYNYFHGMSGLAATFPKEPWFNLFSDGIYASIAQGFSMVVGITSTQTYLQAMFSGKDEKESKKGAFISALLIPPVGFICTLIGLYMRSVNPGIIPKEALPTFIITYLNPWIGGITIATLIISVIGTGAGLTLGISTMINRDIYVKCINKEADDQKQLLVLRSSVCIISLLTMMMVFTNMDSLILEWGFLSMALRGTTIFIPLLGALYFKEKVNPLAGIVAIIVAPIISVLWGIFGIESINSLYIGLGSSSILLIGISMFSKKKEVNS
ncbi:sodium:solute symporter family protein [Crassaminicella profunda]|uniref:sodium:solute symporter family protein n=1 Tax=Crassaminicella profunda TaxID=1286698 RepID=UPI001CA752C3|nr:sodium:solute symporter family protein [Crassaminicella profunda]QZY54838.1 sodium:solute symporter family protein [Crassaminicella profunda]